MTGTSIEEFQAHLDEIRTLAIKMLFDSVPKQVVYISLTIDFGDPMADLYVGEAGDIYWPDVPEWWPLSQVFAHNLSELHGRATAVSDLPEHVRRIVTGSPSWAYGTGHPFVLTRPHA
jgi:hypothetical protein